MCSLLELLNYVLDNIWRSLVVYTGSVLLLIVAVLCFIQQLTWIMADHPSHQILFYLQEYPGLQHQAGEVDFCHQ
jgi:hypothetical protein